ncbi:hypothetical protein [Cryptosporangium aurantiacum]|uniref:Uncharacterized protein n=1 Tax=Cryptosporangium aurantiacum TaxID=134849 RepID=A0A1M7PHE3_9ACTN|nr:hypothetical protein [Cryptosporangium aurantiacum]SHN16505.1 hypothetical protein SAMN05443668_103363 [Cryptosporangium aurantiacum]
MLPFFPAMAEAMDPAPDLLRSLADEFHPIAEQRRLDPTASWIGFHFWLADRFNAAAMRNGFTSGVTLRQARWLLYATCYWGGAEQRKYVAQPLPPEIFTPPTAESTSGMSAALAALDAAVAGSAADKFDLITTLLRTAPEAMKGDTAIIGSLLFGAAYDTFYLITIGEAPPLGQRNPLLRPYQADNVVADPTQFLEVGYADPIPSWLASARQAFEEAKGRNPAEFERILVGSAPGDVPGGPNDLRTLWASAPATASTNWGGDATGGWTQGYFNASMHGNVRWNWGLEAIALTALTGLLQRDAQLADRALVGNSLYVTAWSAFFFGFISASPDRITLPTPTTG